MARSKQKNPKHLSAEELDRRNNPSVVSKVNTGIGQEVKKQMKRVMDENKAGAPANRKHGSYMPYHVEFNKELVTLMKDVMNHAGITNRIKFLATEGEILEGLIMILKRTSEWEKLAVLNEEDLMTQMVIYGKVYGKVLTKAVNDTRNSLSQTLRKLYLKHKKEGRALTPEKLLQVAQRRNLVKLKEKDKDGNVIEEAVQQNKKNRKYRERYDQYRDQWVPKTVGIKNWSVTIRCTKTIDYKMRKVKRM